MGKRIWLTVTVVFILMAAALCVTSWGWQAASGDLRITKQELQSTQAELQAINMGTIIGGAYLDNKTVGFYDAFDANDMPVAGLRIAIYRPAYDGQSSELIATTTVNFDGQYQIRVPAGRYVVAPVLQEMGYAYSFDSAQHLAVKDIYITVFDGQTIQGPIFLCH